MTIPTIDIVRAGEFVPREMAIGDAVDLAAEQWEGHGGWVFDEIRLGYTQMRDESIRVARALISVGVGVGDAVAVWTENVPEFALLLFACARIGARIVPVNLQSREFELGHLLADSNARVLVMNERFRDESLLDVLKRLNDTDGASSQYLPCQAAPNLSTVISLESPSEPGVTNWQVFLASGADATQAEVARRQASVDWREPLLIQYTSGTTATPKGTLCNHRYVLNYGVGLALNMGLRSGESMLNTQPFFHSGGSCAAIPLPLTVQCTVVSARRYSPERIMELIARERCSVRTGYGAMYLMEMNHPSFGRYDLSSLHGGWCVGTPALFEQIRDRMGLDGLVQVYGCTEAAGTCGHFAESWELRTETCGRALPGTEICIVDPHSRAPLATGSRGEIALRGMLTMNGYLGRSDLTSQAMDEHGWVYTGDLGVLDEAGYLRFAGRVKDMLKVGGENVSAEEVEGVILGHPDVAQVAVIGAPDARLGEVVAAIVQRKDGVALDAQSVVDYCSRKLARFRVPRHVLFVDTWPMTASGKIQKGKLRETYLPLLEKSAAGGV